MYCFHIRIYKAIDNLKACERFSKGHSEVLTGLNIKKVTSSNISWYDDPDVYLILIESQNGDDLYAGMRIHIKNKDYQLPIESALDKLDHDVSILTSREGESKTGEMCGMWCQKKMAGNNFGKIMMRAGVAKIAIFLAEKYNLKSVFTLCAPWTLKMVLNMGFQVEKSIGNKGQYPYPSPDLVATVCSLRDVETLKYALDNERDDILSLRKTPKQKKKEHIKLGIIEIEYNLIMSHEEKVFFADNSF